MYKIIQRLLEKFFNNNEFTKEYKQVLTSINSSDQLGQLFNSRAELIKFKERVTEHGMLHKFRHKVKFLETRWNFKYRIWKTQSRG